jgi:hypothetical protein
MEVGDLVTAVVPSFSTSIGVSGIQVHRRGVILKIEQNTEPDDGSFEPIITIFTSDGMISVQGRQITTVDRRAKGSQ